MIRSLSAVAVLAGCLLLTGEGVRADADQPAKGPGCFVTYSYEQTDTPDGCEFYVGIELGGTIVVAAPPTPVGGIKTVNIEADPCSPDPVPHIAYDPPTTPWTAGGTFTWGVWAWAVNGCSQPIDWPSGTYVLRAKVVCFHGNMTTTVYSTPFTVIID